MFTKQIKEAALNMMVSLNPKANTYDALVYKMASEVLSDDGDFYERDFYCFSNFSAFKLMWKGLVFDTSEHAYHWEKFNRDDDRCVGIRNYILKHTTSAHEAFEVANREREHRRKDWDDHVLGSPTPRPVKCFIMKSILREKLRQHEYIQKKARQVIEQKIILTERSWRDSFWGTGPDECGEDWMGRLWREVIREWEQ
jgi:ribA/ribD-fused uncharacterized protein